MGFLDWHRTHLSARHLKELSFEIEWGFFGPEALHDVEPLCRTVIASVMLQQWCSEHLNLRSVPAGDDVQTEPSASNVVDRRTLLGSHHRMNGWHMRRREYGGVFSRGATDPSPPECVVDVPLINRLAPK